MNHNDHVALLRGGIETRGGVWADVGSGTGAFTLALAELVGPGARIYSVDRDARALREQEAALQARFPQTIATYMTADYTSLLNLPPLDGIVAANTLHFLRDKAEALALLRGYLKPGGRLLLVEYNADRGNPWVPYPFTYAAWERLAAANGFVGTRLLATIPSSHLREIYSALSFTPTA